MLPDTSECLTYRHAIIYTICRCSIQSSPFVFVLFKFLSISTIYRERELIVVCSMDDASPANKVILTRV